MRTVIMNFGTDSGTNRRMRVSNVPNTGVFDNQVRAAMDSVIASQAFNEGRRPTTRRSAAFISEERTPFDVRT